MTGTNRNEADPGAAGQRPRAVQAGRRTKPGAVSSGATTHYERWVCLDSADLASLMALMPFASGNRRSGFGIEAALVCGNTPAAPEWPWGV